MQSNPTTDRLVDLVYAALLGESTWQAFLDELRQLLPNGKAVLFYHDADAGIGGFPLSSGFEPDFVAAYDCYYSAINPWMRGATTRGVGRVVQAEAMLPRAELVATEYYNDFLRPQDIQTGLGVTIRREKSCNFLLSLLFDDADDTHIAMAAANLQSIVPHMRRAFDFYRKDENAHGLLAGNGLGDSLGVGVLTIGAGGRARCANAAAAQQIEHSAAVRIDCTGRFRCARSDVTDHVEAVLSAWPRAGGGTGARTFLVATPDKVLPLRLTVLSPASGEEEALFRGPRCTILIEDPNRDIAPAVDEFSIWFGLTAAEKRVVAGIAEGLSLDDIAANADVSIGTVRVQLKHVFAKTGLHRQIDLVRYVCTLAGRLMK